MGPYRLNIFFPGLSKKRGDAAVPVSSSHRFSLLKVPRLRGSALPRTAGRTGPVPDDGIVILCVLPPVRGAVALFVLLPGPF